MKFDFSKTEFDHFVTHCNFTEDELKVLIHKIKGHSVTQISLAINVSDRTVKRYTRSVKDKILKCIKQAPL